MICQHCGSETPAPKGTCTVCNTPIDTPGDQPSEAPTLLPPTGPAAADEDEAHTAVRASDKPSSEAPTMQPLSGPADDEALTGVRTGALPASGQTATRTGPLEVGEPFGTRYQIIEELGAGGMGAVYKAWDSILSVVVAIKVIRPEVLSHPVVARDLERRFKRELLLARMVTHKNVVRIHDLGEIDGIKYITMSYVEGVDLAAILKDEGKLPIPRALRIARRMVSGLKAAHEVEVVHRDLKPSNIMIDVEDEPLIMDFGVARSASAGALEPKRDSHPQQPMEYQPGVTMPGAVVGTYDYMAPEQAKGEEVDQRADLYAFGLILYDLLVGPDRRESRSKQTAEKAEHAEQASLSARKLDPEIPEALDRIVLRCQERDPAARYQTAAELEAELEKLDEKGEPLPLAWRFSRLQIVAAALLSVMAVAGTWWFTRTPPPRVQPAPMSVLIADFQNRTKDTAFDGTLEPMLRRVLEGAGFITAYDRSRIGALGVPRPDRLDEVAARELAVQQGLGVVLSGSIDPQGSGYSISVNATQTVTGEVITSAQGRARSKDQVLDVATRLIARVRNALGDDTSESAQQFAMASLSATSLDVVGLYAAAMEAASDNRFDEAREHAAKAVALDPDFGVGYLVLAVASGNMGRADDGQKYLDEALRHLDGMTERERYSTRAYSYWATGDYEQCVKENSDLLTRYPADVGGRNQLALCLSHLRDMRRAMEEVQKIVEILPSHPVFRDNLALYANYASDFETAEEAARMVEGPDAYAALALAFAQMGQGQVSQARETYERLGQIESPGASFAASGLGDLAAFEGRFSDAVGILRQGAADDLATENTDSAAAKFAAVAYAELSRGRTGAAIEAADEALRHGSAVKIRFLAARTFVEAGDIDRARPLIDGLAGELYAEPRAHAKILEGVIALRNGNALEAMSVLREANDLFDTWIGYFDLGRASLAAGAFPQADGAFDVCLNARRGEALSLFVDEEPTYAYLPLAYYYQGRVRENIGTARYRDSYRQYLDIRGESTEDPLLSEVRERAED